MYTLESLQGLVKQAHELDEKLQRIARNEKLECGQIKEDTIKRYNHLFFWISEACKDLEKGLDGEI